MSWTDKARSSFYWTWDAVVGLKLLSCCQEGKPREGKLFSRWQHAAPRLRESYRGPAIRGPRRATELAELEDMSEAQLIDYIGREQFLDLGKPSCGSSDNLSKVSYRSLQGGHWIHSACKVQDAFEVKIKLDIDCWSNGCLACLTLICYPTPMTCQRFIASVFCK